MEAKKAKKEAKKAKKLAKQIKKLEDEVERRKRQMNGEVQALCCGSVVIWRLKAETVATVPLVVPTNIQGTGILVSVYARIIPFLNETWESGKKEEKEKRNIIF